jgi:RHS repeat-associated protein
MQVVTSSGTLAADYAYGPYGSSLTQFAPSPFGFSSEFLDNIQSLIYFNYRYYHAETGKWIKRDIIELKLADNNYCFLFNNPLYSFDILGLERKEFDQQRDVIIDIIDNENKKSKEKNIEHCGFICKNCLTKKLFRTSTTGSINSCIPSEVPCPEGSIAVAGWHTHAGFDDDYDSEKFSEEDEQWLTAFPTRPPRFYLITPSDRVFYGIIKNGRVAVVPWKNWNRKHPIIREEKRKK